MRPGPGALLAATLAWLPVHAWAAEPRDVAAERFQDGERFARQGSHAAAAQAYEASYGAVPTAEAVYDAAREWEAAGEAARAADDYATAVEKTDLHGPQLVDAKTRLAALESLLGLVTVSGPFGLSVSLAHAVDLAVPAHVHVAPGPYDVRGRDGNRPATRQTILVSAGQRVSVSLTLVPLPAPPPATDVAGQPPVGPAGGGALRTAGWISMAGAVVLAGTSAALYFKTKSARDDFVGTSDASESLHETATAWRTATYVGYGATGLAAAASVVFFVLGSAARPSPPLRPAIGANGWRISF
jgi:hypothetical protein